LWDKKLPISWLFFISAKILPLGYVFLYREGASKTECFNGYGVWSIESQFISGYYEVNDRFLYRFFFHRYPEEGEDLQPVYFSLEAL